MGTLPIPGLRGDFRESCVICMGGTDTALGLAGEGEFILAGVMVLGVPEAEAHWMVEQHFDCAPGMVPDGWVSFVMRLCASCAERSGAPKPGLIASGEIPFYVQPEAT